MFRRLRSLLTRSPRRPAAIRADLLAYCGSWVDEVWIRTTVGECRRRGMRVVLAVSGDAPVDAAQASAHRDHRVDLRLGADRELIARIEAPLLVSATTSVGDLPFHPNTRTRVHMPHSLVSLHMIYAADAFDGFDVLFACGPHHVTEFAALAQARGQGDPRIYPVGYGKLDVLRTARAKQRSVEAAGIGDRPHAVIALTWGPGNLLEDVGVPLCEALLDEGWRVTLRPHPGMCIGDNPLLRSIESRCGEHPEFAMERSTDGDESLLTADVMVSDYSGVAFEFAALRNRPCVFIDGPPKVLNTDWRELGPIPVEIAMRERLGRVAAPNVADVHDAVRQLLKNRTGEPLSACVGEFLFDTGACATRAADRLEALLKEARDR